MRTTACCLWRQLAQLCSPGGLQMLLLPGSILEAVVAGDYRYYACKLHTSLYANCMHVCSGWRPHLEGDGVVVGADERASLEGAAAVATQDLRTEQGAAGGGGHGKAAKRQTIDSPACIQSDCMTYPHVGYSQG